MLDALAGRAFARADFHETREGACRLMPPLAKLVAESTPRWTHAVAPVAEGVARALAASAVGGAHSPLPTPLTQANRSAGRDGLRRGERSARAPAAPLPRRGRGREAALPVPLAPLVRRERETAAVRAMLRLSGACPCPVPPLALPDPAGSPSAEAVARAEAVRRFVAPAQAVHPRRRLDGAHRGPAVRVGRRAAPE